MALNGYTRVNYHRYVNCAVFEETAMQLPDLIQHPVVFLAPLKREFTYLDPGTGSFLLQLLLATFLGSLFLVKTFWKRIKTFFGRLFSRNKLNIEQPEEEHPENVQPNVELPGNDQQ